jgi:hypothetical protein
MIIFTILFLLPYTSDFSIIDASKTDKISYVSFIDYFILPYYNPSNIKDLIVRKFHVFLPQFKPYLDRPPYAGDESTVTLTPFFWLALAVVLIKSSRTSTTNVELSLILTSFILFFLSTHEVLRLTNLYFLFQRIPLMNSIYVLSRISIIVDTFLIFSVIFLYPKIPLNSKKVVTLLIFLSIIASFPFKGFPYHSVSNDDIAKMRKISKTYNDFSVLVLPLECSQAYGSFLSIYHKGKMISGLTPRVPHSSLKYLRDMQIAILHQNANQIKKLVSEAKLCCILIEKNEIKLPTCNYLNNLNSRIFLQLENYVNESLSITHYRPLKIF